MKTLVMLILLTTSLMGSVAHAVPPNETVAYLTILKLKPGMDKAFKDELNKIVNLSQHEPGNIAWYVQQSDKDPTDIVFYTRWENQAAIQAHLKQPLLVIYLQNTAPMLAQPAQLLLYHPLDLN